MNRADFYIERLKLIPHPEGGYYREVYRSEEMIKNNALPGYYNGDRFFSTSIYFLLKGKQKSNLHKLKSDEIWHFYNGSPLKLYIINKKGELSGIKLGRNAGKGEMFQYIIEKGQWFCAEVIDKKSYSLIGCTVSPGFDFSDFELGKRKKLIKIFPGYKKLINDFTAG